MAGLYDFALSKKRETSPMYVNQEQANFRTPATDITNFAPPVKDVEAEFKKSLRQNSKPAPEPTIKQLQDMESLGQGYPMYERTPTPAQGYASAEDLAVAANPEAKRSELNPGGYSTESFNKALGLNGAHINWPKTAQPEPAPTPEAPSNLPQGLMLSPDQQKVASKIMDSVQANPDDPKKWGHPGVIAHETDSGTQMPNGWGVVKDSKGRIHVAPPSRWNFYGDTKAEEQWRDAENAKRASREVTQTLADEAIKARSSFVGPKRRAQAVDSMLGLESIRNNAANAKYSAGLNAALNRQAALEKEGRQRYDNVLTNVFNILKAEKPEADYPGEAGRIMRRIMADESLFAKVNSMNPNETANLASELANQGLIDEHIRKKSGVGKGLNDTYLDWKLKNPSTWFGRKGLYDTDNNFIDLDGLDTEQQRAIFVAKLRQGLIDDVKSGKITEAEALQILNTRLAENGFLIPERVW